VLVSCYVTGITHCDTVMVLVFFLTKKDITLTYYINNGMPTTVHWLHYFWPKFVASSSFLATVYFGLYDFPIKSNVPKYSRVFLLFFSCINLGGGLPHWILKPYGGLEKIARLKLSKKPSVEKDMMAFLQGEDGIHRTFLSFIVFWVVFKAPELTNNATFAVAIYQTTKLFTEKFWKPAPILGLKNAPGRFRPYIQNLPIIIACSYSWWSGDLLKYWYKGSSHLQ
jgi:hypothetical protein